MVQRNAGDKPAAVKDMDSKVGPEWQLEIVIEDEIGPEFIDPKLLDKKPKPADGEERDKMFEKARGFSETFVRPGDDLEYDPVEHPKEPKDKMACLSKMLKKMATMLDED
jgi:hypothetical protein